MLVYFRKKQLQLLSGILVMFLGGWLSVFCQHCQAYAAVNNDLLEQESNDHCDHDPSPQKPIDKQHSDSDCLGACDDDNNELIGADSLQSVAAKFSKSYQPDTFIYHKQYTPASYSQSLISTNSHSLVFERACYLPLDRFCVQLK